MAGHVFERTKDAFKVLILAPILDTTIAATIRVTSLCLGGYAWWTEYACVWLDVATAFGACAASSPRRTAWLRDRGMRISESHWNVFLGHAGATLTKFEVPEAEQREVVALVQSLMKEIVE